MQNKIQANTLIITTACTANIIINHLHYAHSGIKTERQRGERDMLPQPSMFAI